MAPVAGASESTTKAGGVEGGRTPAATPTGGGSSVKKKSGKEKRREKRLRNEPRSVSGELTPLAINVMDFAEARATELKAMTQVLSKKPGDGGKRVFQQLPRHMRRRAMSHNIRRLPRRLQEKAAKEMEKQAADKEGKKKKSRKQRRKIRNLREERSGRGQDRDSAHPQRPVWLETHVWHAKRMKMIDHHGYRVAESVNDKGVRQAYRSMRYGCLLSDVSYQCCIEVAGRRCDILSCLTPFFSSDTGLTPAAVSYENGSRAGHCVMYRSGTYPSGGIGPVEFLWQPLNNDVDTARLWLTVPPAIHNEVMDELTAAMEKGFRTGCHGDYQLETENSGVSGDERRRSKVTVTSLRDEFVRFRLVGPRSHAVLMETLKPIAEGNDTTTFARSDVQTLANEMLETSETSDHGTLSFSKPDLSRIPSPVPWWSDARNECLQNNLGDLRSATEPVEFPKGTVVGMVVQDPRLFTPSKKTDMVSGFYPRRKVDWWSEEGGRGGGRDRGEGEGGKYVEREGKERVEEEEEPNKKAEAVEEMEVLEEEEEEREMKVDGGEGKESEPEEGEDNIPDKNETEQEKQIFQDDPPIETDDTLILAERSIKQPKLEVGTTSPDSSLPNLSYSPLWCPRVREIVSKSKIPQHILNEVRSNVLVHTTHLCLGDKSPRIPVMLVRQDYSSAHVHGVLQLGGEGFSPRGYKNGVGKSVATSSVAGWDLVLPREWGMGVWVSLVYRGARACGRTELRKYHLETGVPFFPEDYPDTGAGRKEAEKREREAEVKYRRHPPDKRRNFGKLSIQHPFRSPWGELVGEWKKKKMDCVLSGAESDLSSEVSDREKCVVEHSVSGEGERVGGEEEGELIVAALGNEMEGEGEGGNGENGESGEEGVASEPPAKRLRVANGDRSDIIVKPQTPFPKSGDGSDFYVLRSKSALFSLSSFFHCLSLARPVSHSGTASDLSQAANSINPSFDSLVKDFQIDKLLEEHRNALIGVTFEMLHRGNATSNDIISMPTLSDLQNLTDSGGNFNGPEERLCSRGLTVVEGDVVCVGVSGLSRSKMAEVRKNRSKRKKKKERWALDDEEIRAERSREEVASSIVQDYALTSTTQSRLIIGYTTSCGHRLTSSKDGGIGFCSLRGLMEAARVYHDFRVGGEGRREEREKWRGEREEGEKGRGWRGRSILLLVRGEWLHHRFAQFDLLHR